MIARTAKCERNRAAETFPPGKDIVSISKGLWAKCATMKGVSQISLKGSESILHIKDVLYLILNQYSLWTEREKKNACDSLKINI